MHCILFAGRVRQSKAQQRIKQALLGALDDLPAFKIQRIADRRYGFVVAAGGAKDIATWTDRNQPVASGELGVGAEGVAIARKGRSRLGSVAFGKRDQSNAIRDIAELMAASLADCVLKVDCVAAMVAGKEFHFVAPRPARQQRVA